MKKSSHLLGHDNIAPFTGVIFDCDGVLLDSLESNIVYYNALLNKLGLDPMTPEQIAYVHMHTADEGVQYIVPEARWEEIDAARKALDYFTEVLPHIKVIPGLFQILERLRDAGYKLGICTNRKNTMERVNELFGFNRYFFPTLTAGKAIPKPHPESVYRILSTWKCAREDVVFIGDSEMDQKTAQAAGVRFWAYANPELTAELYIPDFWALGQTLRLPPAGMATDRARLGWPFWS